MTDGAPVRVGLLGTGRIGRMHAELLSGRVSGATLGAVYDASSDRARETAARFGVPATASAAELFGSSEIDAIAICTNTDTHVDPIVAAAAASKAIFCEKPVSLELADVDRALAAVDRAGVLFQVGFNRRFDPATSSVREAVASASVGDVHLVRISSRDPSPPPLEYARGSGGIFLDMTIHDFDMARYVTGSEVSRSLRAAPCGSTRAGRVRRHRHGRHHAHARERCADRDRQQPPGRLRL